MGVCARVEPPRDEAPGGEGVRPAGDLGHRGQARRVLSPVLAGKNRHSGQTEKDNMSIVHSVDKRRIFKLVEFPCWQVGQFSGVQ